MGDEEKKEEKLKTPGGEKKAQEEFISQPTASEHETGVSRVQTPQGDTTRGEDKEILQAIHDTINHMLQMISGAAPPQDLYRFDRAPLGYSFAMHYPQLLPAQAYPPFTGGVPYPAAPQTLPWPGSTVHPAYLVQ